MYVFVSHLSLLKADRNRDKFQHISDSELAQRKQFVESMVKDINGTHLPAHTLCPRGTLLFVVVGKQYYTRNVYLPVFLTLATSAAAEKQ